MTQYPNGIDPDALNLQHPQLPPHELQAIAQRRRDLWPAVAAHPNCPPQLGQWVHGQMGLQTAAPAQLAHAFSADGSSGATAARKKGPFPAWPAIVGGIAGLLMAISMFLPVAQSGPDSLTFFDPSLDFPAWGFFGTYLVAGLLCFFALFINSKVYRVLAGIITLLVGLAGAGMAFYLLSESGKEGYTAYMGIGLYLMAIGGVLLVAMSLALMFTGRKRA